MAFMKAIARKVQSFKEKLRAKKTLPENNVKEDSALRRGRSEGITPAKSRIIPRTTPATFGKSGITLPGAVSSESSESAQQLDSRHHEAERAPDTSAYTSTVTPTRSNQKESSTEPSLLTSEEWLESSQLSSGTKVEETVEAAQAFASPEVAQKINGSADEQHEKSTIIAPETTKHRTDKHFYLNPSKEKARRLRQEKQLAEELQKAESSVRRLELEKHYGQQAADFLYRQLADDAADCDNLVELYHIISEQNEERRAQIEVLLGELGEAQQGTRLQEQRGDVLSACLQGLQGRSDAAISEYAFEIQKLKAMLRKARGLYDVAKTVQQDLWKMEDNAAAWERKYNDVRQQTYTQHQSIVELNEQVKFHEDNATKWMKKCEKADAEVDELEATVADLRNALQESQKTTAAQHGQQLTPLPKRPTPPDSPPTSKAIDVIEIETLTEEELPEAKEISQLTETPSWITIEGTADEGSIVKSQSDIDMTDLDGLVIEDEEDHEVSNTVATLETLVRESTEEVLDSDPASTSSKDAIESPSGNQNALWEQNALYKGLYQGELELRQKMEEQLHYEQNRVHELQQSLDQAMIDTHEQYLKDVEGQGFNDEGALIGPNQNQTSPNIVRDQEHVINHQRELLDTIRRDNARLAKENRQYQRASAIATKKVETLSRKVASLQPCKPVPRLDEDSQQTGSAEISGSTYRHTLQLQRTLEDLEGLRAKHKEESKSFEAAKEVLLASEASACRDLVEVDAQLKQSKFEIQDLQAQMDTLRAEKDDIETAMTLHSHRLTADLVNAHIRAEYEDQLDYAAKVQEGQRVKLRDWERIAEQARSNWGSAMCELDSQKLTNEGLVVNNVVLKAKVKAFEMRFLPEILEEPLEIDLRDEADRFTEARQMETAREIDTSMYALVGMKAAGPSPYSDIME